LLVVISVIGLLSSIIVASLNNARNQGSQAAGLTFATHTYQAFGADALFNYNFDSLSGSNILDTSGNNRTLTPNTGSFTLSNKTPNLRGNSLTSGGATYAQSGTISPPVTSNAYTLGTWVYFNSLSCGSSCIIAETTNGTGYPIIIYWDGTNFICESDMLNGSTLTFSGVQTGRWYYIACSAFAPAAVNGSLGYLNAYINGKVVASTSGATVYYTPGNAGFTNIYINGDLPNTLPGINGYVDDVSLYARAI